jgi:hypothetical protein
VDIQVKKRFVNLLILIFAMCGIAIGFWYFRREPSRPGEVAVSPQAIFWRIKRRIEFRRLGAKSNATPINFYGAVQDQYDQPIPNVTISYDNFHSEELPQAREVRSGKDGRFLITDTGTFRRLYARKAGYQMACSLDDYHPIKTTAANPFLLRMWRQKGPEELIKIRNFFEFDPAQGAVFFDLVKGEPVKEEVISSSLFREPARRPTVASLIGVTSLNPSTAESWKWSRRISGTRLKLPPMVIARDLNVSIRLPWRDGLRRTGAFAS